MGETPSRSLPHDIEAERALLGAVLLAPSVLDSVSESIRYYDFHRPAHRVIFEAMTDMRAFGIEIDSISVKDHIEKAGALDAAGGAMYLLDLADACVTTSHAPRYAAIVREKAVFRQLVDIGIRLEAIGYDASGSTDSAVGEATSLVLGLTAAQNSATLPLGTALTDLVALLRLGKQDFLYSEILPWAHIVKGDLVVIGAASSVGKTAFALNLADEWSKGQRVAFFEYEMSAIALSQRIVSKYTGIPKSEMDDGLTPEQVEAVERTVSQLSRTRKLYIESVSCDINSLVAKVRNEAQRGTQVVLIDYLGLIPFGIPKGINHAKAVGLMVTNRLKRLATELGIVIVLLSQIGREGAKKWGFIPSKEDLRDSGEIEQDADIVIMLGREWSMEDDSNAHVRLRQDKGLDPFAADAKDFTLIGCGVRKNRNGALGEKWVRFYGAQMKYTDIHPMITDFTRPTTTQAEQGSLHEEEVDGVAGAPDSASLFA